jgi:ribosome maturation factor RimP
VAAASPARVSGAFFIMLDFLVLERRLEEFLALNAYSLVDFQVVMQGRGRIFKLFVERADGSPADLGDCVRLSPLVQLFLESLEVFNDASSLQVSSPGLDRALKRDADFTRFAGKAAVVSLRVEGRKSSLTGELVGMSDGKILVRTTELAPELVGELGIGFNDGVASLPRKLVTAARLKVEE